MEIPPVAIGAIGAALITSAMTFISLVHNKEQKTSEFRQAWIDALRNELSDVIAHLNAIQGAVEANYSSSQDRWKVVREDYIGINRATAKIRLRLNSNEDASKNILAIIENLEILFAPGNRVDYRDLNDREKKLVTGSQVLLKQEWDRVKKGELTYRVAKNSAFIVFVCSILALGAMYL